MRYRFLQEMRMNTSLGKFDSKNNRPVSKDQHVTISREVKDKITQCYSWIRERCKTSGKRDRSFYACKVSTLKHAIQSMHKLKAECTKNKFHRKRCERTCNAALKHLIADYNNSMKHLS